MLKPLDTLEILAIVDNEVDPISKSPACVSALGGLGVVAMQKGKDVGDSRGGGVVKEVAMEQVCCGAHGLSLMITGIHDNERQTLLFDTGPTGKAWADNASRLGPPLQNISLIHLSHWHPDHSGGMIEAIRNISQVNDKIVVDVHPNRPMYRGIRTPVGIVSLEADPTIEEIEKAGANVQRRAETHEILDDFFLTSGNIPRVTPYEVGIRGGVRFDPGNGKWEDDQLIEDERFVLCHVKNKGLAVFTGCSHAGVVNTAKHAIELANTFISSSVPLYAIVGGFHLADATPEQIASTVQDLKGLGVKVLLAGHCTGWRAKFEIEKAMPGSLVPSFVGTKTVI